MTARTDALRERLRADALKTYPATRLDARAKEIAATGIPLLPDAYKLAMDEEIARAKR